MLEIYCLSFHFENTFYSAIYMHFKKSIVLYVEPVHLQSSGCDTKCIPYHVKGLVKEKHAFENYTTILTIKTTQIASQTLYLELDPLTTEAKLSFVDICDTILSGGWRHHLIKTQVHTKA